MKSTSDEGTLLHLIYSHWRLSCWVLEDRRAEKCVSPQKRSAIARLAKIFVESKHSHPISGMTKTLFTSGSPEVSSSQWDWLRT